MVQDDLNPNLFFSGWLPKNIFILRNAFKKNYFILKKVFDIIMRGNTCRI